MSNVNDAPVVGGMTVEEVVEKEVVEVEQEWLNEIERDLEKTQEKLDTANAVISEKESTIVSLQGQIESFKEIEYREWVGKIDKFHSVNDAELLKSMSTRMRD